LVLGPDQLLLQLGSHGAWIRGHRTPRPRRTVVYAFALVTDRYPPFRLAE
jgi:hypothetical protein